MRGKNTNGIGEDQQTAIYTVIMNNKTWENYEIMTG